MAGVSDDASLQGRLNVVVRRCDIDSEDDAICLKSSRRLCENILIENCRIRSSCNALKFGTASAKGFKDITVRNLEIYDTYFSGIALEIVDGGVMENVKISKVRMTTTTNPIFIRLGHRNAKGPVGSIKGVTISDVTADVPNRRKNEMNKFPECAQNYPESKMFGVLPAWGLYCRHAEGLAFENVTLRVSGRDYRAAAIFDDVRKLTLDRFSILSAGKEPVIVLSDVQHAVLSNSRAPEKAVRFIEMTGDTRDVKGP